MSPRRCGRCRKIMGPWEGKRCISCDPTRDKGKLSTYDAITWILEQEDRPISEYDARRALRREFDWDFTSVAPYLSNDPRFCWAGRGVFGLHRHGPIPGPRNLAGVGTFVLYSHRDDLHLEELAFVMKWLGYRFQEPSLAQALRSEPSVEGWWRLHVSRNNANRSRLKNLRIAPTFAVFEEMADRYSKLIGKGLREREKRLANG
jgi:hypothetical protein